MNDNNPPKGTKGWDHKRKEWTNYFWKYYYKSKDSILEYQRSRSDVRRIKNHRNKLEWYETLLENAYEMEFEHLIQYHSPVIGLLKSYRWLYMYEIKDDKYVYLFDPMFMDKDKEIEFREKLHEIVETRLVKKIIYYEDNRDNE